MLIAAISLSATHVTLRPAELLDPVRRVTRLRHGERHLPHIGDKQTIGLLG
jgi:hypothetical protein